ncbi:stalk domain-containing protein [Paenibacillus sp. GCM10012306]
MQTQRVLRKILYIFIFIFIMGLTVNDHNVVNAGSKEISVILDGKVLELSKKTVTINDVNYVPLRGVLEQMGVNIQWNQSSGTIIARKGAQIVEYTLGNSYARINTMETVMSSPGKIIDGSVMVPLRFVGEAFGAKVTWNAAARSITIISDDMLLASISPEPTGNTASNLMNNGFAVKQGKWIYGLENEQSGYPTHGNGGYLYKVNEDDGKSTKLVPAQARMLNVQDDRIFYIGPDGIYKILTDGKEGTRLIDSSSSRHLYLLNNWLFYDTEDGIYRLQTDRLGAIPIRVLENPNVDQFTVSQGWVYYKGFRDNDGQTGELGRIRINGRDNIVYGRFECNDLTVHGGYLYFNYFDENTDTNKIGRMPAVGGELHYLVDAEGYNISNNLLFYGKGTVIYRSELDGTNAKPVANLESWPMPLKFVIFNDFLFYEKSIFGDNGQHASAVYGVNLAAKKGWSLFGKSLPAERKDNSHLYPHNDKEKINEVEQYAKKVVQQTVSPDMTPREKIKALHDYVVKNTAYDYENYIKDTIPENSYTVYGTLIEHKAVCEGYALTMNVLLKLAGMESYLISGLANGQGHAWNIVVLNGVYYHLDATWDDSAPDIPGQVKYDYFLISDDQMALDHEFDTEGIKGFFERKKMLEGIAIDFE